MTFSVNNRELENLGSVNAAVLEINVSSYDATNGEDVSASGLGIANDPILVLAIPDGNKWVPQWDKGTNALRFNGDKGTASSGGEPEEAAGTTTIGDVQLIALYHGT